VIDAAEDDAELRADRMANALLVPVLGEPPSYHAADDDTYSYSHALVIMHDAADHDTYSYSTLPGSVVSDKHDLSCDTR
jgi:hypothetical protein